MWKANFVQKSFLSLWCDQEIANAIQWLKQNPDAEKDEIEDRKREFEQIVGGILPPGEPGPSSTNDDDFDNDRDEL